MKIEKAIEILDLNIKSAGKQMPTDTLQAVIMSTDALKRIHHSRYQSKNYQQPPLEGEEL